MPLGALSGTVVYCCLGCALNHNRDATHVSECENCGLGVVQSGCCGAEPRLQQEGDVTPSVAMDIAGMQGRGVQMLPHVPTHTRSNTFTRALSDTLTYAPESSQYSRSLHVSVSVSLTYTLETPRTSLVICAHLGLCPLGSLPPPPAPTVRTYPL